MKYLSSPHKLYGFTIVELVLVITVIGILAGLTTVAWSGWRQNTATSEVKSDLLAAASAMENAKNFGSGYPSSVPSDFKGSSNVTITYYSGDGSKYCIDGISTTDSSIHYFIDITKGKEALLGTCATGEDNGGGDSTMQTFTTTDCNSLATYTGSNSSALKTLTDPRGSSQSYTIGKLADGHCWMLDNLKLGSTSGTLTLTPSDSNVAFNFTLPQVQAGGSASYDTPTASGPVPGDTGSGATNYGYLYNWSAATAGETRTTKPAGSSNASYSICPKGWRLPSGGSSGESNNLYTAMGSTAASWQFSGPFRGVLSGAWTGSFSLQSSEAGLWSSSPDTSSANYALYVRFNASSIYPSNNYYRYYGFGVRCLLS